MSAIYLQINQFVESLGECLLITDEQVYSPKTDEVLEFQGTLTKVHKNILQALDDNRNYFSENGLKELKEEQSEKLSGIDTVVNSLALVIPHLKTIFLDGIQPSYDIAVLYKVVKKFTDITKEAIPNLEKVLINQKLLLTKLNTPFVHSPISFVAKTVSYLEGLSASIRDIYKNCVGVQPALLHEMRVDADRELRSPDEQYTKPYLIEFESKLILLQQTLKKAINQVNPSQRKHLHSLSDKLHQTLTSCLRKWEELLFDSMIVFRDETRSDEQVNQELDSIIASMHKLILEVEKELAKIEENSNELEEAYAALESKGYEQSQLQHLGPGMDLREVMLEKYDELLCSLNERTLYIDPLTEGA